MTKIIAAALLAAAAVICPGVAHADCREGSSYTSQDSGITYHCVGGQYYEGPYGGSEPPGAPCFYSPAHPECPPAGLTPQQRENW
jgi:hypothetical protein